MENNTTPFVLMRMGKTWFVQHPKKQGQGQDTGVPQFRVTRIVPVGKSRHFYVHYVPCFVVAYSIEDIQRIAPFRANAYKVVGVVRSDVGGITIHAQFYQVEVDETMQIAELG